MKINYSFNKSTEQQIKDHLWRMDPDFTPPLHTYVDINQYAQKLVANAVRIDNFMGTNLIGLIATYYNPEKEFLFFSNMSIEKKYRGKGVEISRGLLSFLDKNQDQTPISPEIQQLAIKWLEVLKNDAKPEKFIIKSIQIEVRNTNRKAMLFYKRLGFKNMKIEKESTYLIKHL